MKNTWLPQEAAIDDDYNLSIEYQNSKGDIIVFSNAIERGEKISYLRQFCWYGCSGDWPGCLRNCPLLEVSMEYDKSMDR